MLQRTKEAVGPEYYNKALRYASRPFEKSPWRHLYEAAIELIPTNWRVLDLGCGTGVFAKALFDRKFVRYVGIDFAEERIKIARQQGINEAGFLQGDFFNPALTHWFDQSDIVILLEVLEHIDQDLALVGKIRPGKTIVVAVPNYNEKSHVRFFASLEEVKERYSKLIVFDHEQILPHAEKHEIFLLRGIRR